MVVMQERGIADLRDSGHEEVDRRQPVLRALRKRRLRCERRRSGALVKRKVRESA